MTKTDSFTSKGRKSGKTGKIVLLVLMVFFLFTAGFVAVSEQPGFCNSCHIMGPYYDSWRNSAHSKVNCLECHLQPGFAGHIQGKIFGVAQAFDCMVGRMSTKPSATVMDKSCLREGCHSKAELESKEVEYKKYKFSHKNHIAARVAGITISCGTCHSHFEGTEHFTVNTQMCFTCHFLTKSEGSKRVVETKCRDCHNTPGEPLKRSLVEVNHADFVSYEASCEESCHKKQIVIPSVVPDATCLSCHNYRVKGEVNSVEIHQQHSNGEKVECFACHGEVDHNSSTGITLAAMLDCKSCHSDTHEVQRTIYTAMEEPHNPNDMRILSPMFMTHVACNGCHIEKQHAQQGVLDSLGTVAKAVPRACDRCHGAGTGDKYIPFWQKETRQLYEKVNARVVEQERRIANEQFAEPAAPPADKVKQARLLLDAVVADGSWGVHNLKYTEDMLIKAKNIITAEEQVSGR